MASAAPIHYHIRAWAMGKKCITHVIAWADLVPLTMYRQLDLKIPYYARPWSHECLLACLQKLSNRPHKLNRVILRFMDRTTLVGRERIRAMQCADHTDIRFIE